ncbi:hypothetical protein [Erythrobacter aureus]|uniref:Uncharacterized protein n=1 Tax=Erythrobacter aureus TaxID=2182384 RepID=A0A345YJJ3_9SPHN|nr:hypothetical protein [Erythrobacter aureus]AXK44095.1 hypothetical protein DVR09_16715 [Erythrobacter aureus]
MGIQLAPPRELTCAVENAHLFEDLEDDEFDPSRPAPVELLVRNIDPEDKEWATHHGLSKMRRANEGASFLAVTPDVQIISVRGAQPLHHDRHIAWADLPYSSEHTWNLVVEPSDGQMLVLETSKENFEHFRLVEDAFIYFNTSNGHMVTRKQEGDQVVIAQVQGFGPHEAEAALTRLKAVLSARPTPTPV